MGFIIGDEESRLFFPFFHSFFFFSAWIER